MSEKIIRLTSDDSLFSTAENGDFASYYRQTKGNKSLTFELIEFKNVVNPSTITLLLNTTGKRENIQFYKLKREMLFQNGVFSYYPDAKMDFFQIPFFTSEGRDNYFTLKASSSIEEKFELLLYFSIVQEFKPVFA